jgi:RNAse (barnase) inhibitor barstar
MAETTTTLESRLLQNGCVVLYHDPFLMENHSCQLTASGWQFKEIYTAVTGTTEEFFEQVALILEFPGYFGRNLDALNDCMRDISFPEIGRLALGLERFDILARTNPAFAHSVLDIFAGIERGFLMEGKRLLFLVQSNDPNLQFAPVGQTPVSWNFKEWLNSDRKNLEISS